MSLDYQLFDWINQFAGRNSSFDHCVILFSKYGPLLFGFMFVWLWFTKTGDPTENRKMVLFAIIIVILTLGVDKLIEMMYFRPRPFVSHDVMLLIQKSNTDPSFPSNHAAGSFALAFALFWKRRKPGSILLILAALMALSRIFIGVHYPFDVIAGALIAFGVTCIVIWQRRFLEPLFNWLITTFRKSKSGTIE